MSVELPTKVAQGRRDRVESQLAVAAEGACLHVLTDAPHKSKILAGALKLADALQDLKQVAHAHSAGKTLAAGLVLAEGDQ